HRCTCRDAAGPARALRGPRSRWHRSLRRQRAVGRTGRRTWSGYKARIRWGSSAIRKVIRRAGSGTGCEGRESSSRRDRRARELPTNPSEPRRCGVHDGDAAVADLAHFHRTLADPIAEEAEWAIEPEEAVVGQHASGREIAARLPVLRNAER